MKLVLVVHGFPPELYGGTENSTLALARALAGRGHQVNVIAGSMEWEQGFRSSVETQTDPDSGAPFEVHRIHRCDAFFDHWQKAEQPLVGRAFDQLLDQLQPDVVHVQHWIRLTNDLVHRAALRGIPAVVTAHDLWTSCLVAFRVRPDTRQFCELPLASDACLDCSKHMAPRPVWQTPSEGAAQVRAFRDAARRELETARVVVTPSLVHGEALGRWLELDGGGFGERLRVVAPARRDAAHLTKPKSIPSVVSVTEPLALAHFGHWSELKGTDLLLDALELTREPGRFRLLLGGGAAEPEFGVRMAQMVASSQAQVEVLGDYESENLAEHGVAEGVLFVSTSRAHESFGLVVDEALELGQGILVPNLGAFAERAACVDWATTFTSGDAADLARVLDRLADHPDQVRSLSDGALRAVAEDDRKGRASELSAHVEQMLEIYGECQRAGAPQVEPRPEGHDAARLAALDAWDAALSRADPKEAGLA